MKKGKMEITLTRRLFLKTVGFGTCNSGILDPQLW